MRSQNPRRSISAKLVLLVVVAVAAAVVAATGLSLWQETNRYAAAKRESLEAVAQVFASATAAATAAHDRTAALQALRAIGRVPGILHARIVSSDGRTLAVLGFASQLDRDVKVATSARDVSVWQLLGSRSLEVSVPIVNAGNPVGRLVLVGDTSDLIDTLLDDLRLKLVGGVLALGVGLLIAGRLQKSIISPLRTLTQTMGRIRESHDYDARVKAESNDEVGVLVEGFNQMLSEIKDRDRKLETHLQNLEQQVSDRTRDLSVARDAAESASAAKSDFLATMSHEIRTPMNGIMVMAELLAAAELPDRQRRYADVIAKSGQSLLAIINDILDFSKIESGKLELEEIQFDPADIADQVVSLFSERARTKGLDLAAYVSPAISRQLNGDPVRLNQVIGNLVNNALKFTESGQVEVTVEPDPAAPDRVRFAIADSGIGIPEGKLGAIFSAFSQADQSTTRRFGGTGLGLAICKRLVNAMHSDIQVTSEVGKGSVFAFSIPAAPGEPRPWPRVGPAGGQGPHAVVAVDGAATRSALTRYLADAGYRVSASDDGKEPPALIIAEAQRAAQFVAGWKGGRPPILCLTAIGDPTADQMVAKGQAAGTLSRPLLHSELHDVLAAIQSGEGQAALTARRSGAVEEVPALPHLRVLVADDSPVNREVVIEALSRMKVSVDVVENGVQAVAAATARRYDLVLMDGSMPEMDGFEASRRIRQAEEAAGSPKLPIVALTAHVVGAAADAWREAGMDGVLHKPFTIRALADCLMRLAPHQAQPGQAGTPNIVSLGERNEPAGREEEAILDPEILGQLDDMAANGRADFVNRVCGLYLDHAPKTHEDLKRALADRDTEALGRAAHALKSMSYNIGAIRLARLAGDIERAARIDNTIIGGPQYDSFATVLAATLDAVKSRLGENEQPARLPAAGRA